ncbi:DUF1643 domain-containing protein [Burkholderia pseudomultivorans]|uniref:DUF1643 domain-containing protein n=1 Tax=Burkholderia pseudomultivorans TaxID=1207504 RepID=UPI0007591FF1|nr:DUF1643 domain-containing protein [Burkholderia pseudomultivorans]KVC19730.1 hypothetical protein WS55_22720 [Burkholderia pseudomultivorans]KVC32081.1 hypothetical protein WS56_14325 [Burkholderia pseudomultivorans]
MSTIISECGQYRYLLSRPADCTAPMKSAALFLMLNPSTADASLDDPTIRRCRGFAKTWDCNGISVANLYALRSTDPVALWSHADPVGPDNDTYLRKFAYEYGDVVCAWGANARDERVSAVVAILREAGARLWCLGTTKDGSPRHPLYVRADQPLIEWNPA